MIMFGVTYFTRQKFVLLPEKKSVQVELSMLHH